MTSEHLRPLLDDWSSMQVLVKAAEIFARAEIPESVVQIVKMATFPHQYALSTRAGCECIAHALQGLTEMDPRATVTSIDGVSAFDLISRGAMMKGLLQVEGGDTVLPFVRMFHGAPSQYLGRTHATPLRCWAAQGPRSCFRSVVCGRAPLRVP